MTIQHAVDVDAAAGCSGDTVNVAAGTYPEQVTIGTVLNLVGAGAATTKIQVPPPPTAGNGDIVTIQAGATVELSGFTVTGPLSANCTAGAGNFIGGINVLPGGTASIHDNIIADVRNEPLGGCQDPATNAGIAIGVGSSSGAATATIVNNTIVRYQKNGIRVKGTGSMATITGNTVTGVGATPIIGQNGIFVTSGGSATVSGNTVTGNECNVPNCGPDPITDVQAIGILAGTGTIVTGNSVAANDIGIYNFAEGAATTLISGNTVTGNRFEDIVLDQGDALVDDNTIDPGNIGIVVVSFNGSTANSTGTLTCNRISQATQAGIRLLVQAGSTFTAVATATNNSITGNAVGFDNTITTGPPVDARQNWWGCPAGPGNLGCDSVSANVDASSPLPAPPTCIPTTTTTTTTLGPLTTTTAAATTTTVTPTTSTTTTPPPQCLSDASCGDHNICNGIETCRAGVCVAGTPLNCDDGDPCTLDSCAPTSGCQHTMVANLASCSIVIPGGQKKKADCYVFADVAGSHSIDNPKTLSCADGDPTCDMDGKCNNVCALKVRLCINSATLPPCSPPSQLTSLKFKSHPATFTLNTPAQLTGAQCSAFNDVNLPVKVSKKGKKSTGVLKVTASAKAPKPAKPPTDKDTYVMKCVPGCTP
jgi:hypothetical protein